MIYVLVIVAIIAALGYWVLKTRRDMEWSMGKGIVAHGPAEFGHHFVFVDRRLKVAVFLPKADGTLHVMIGTPTKAVDWLKYDANGNQVAGSRMEGGCEWKITRRALFYRGPILPRQGPAHRAMILDVDNFSESVSPEFVERKAHELLRHVREHGKPPMRAVAVPDS